MKGERVRGGALFGECSHDLLAAEKDAGEKVGGAMRKVKIQVKHEKCFEHRHGTSVSQEE